jgi:hypothetical protein
MKKQLVMTWLVAIICLLTAKSAQASTLYKEWSYAIDSFNDSTQGTPLRVGGTDYEIYGTAFKQTDHNIFLAINANTPIGGVASGAQDGYTRWGDILFNFSGQNLNTANANGSLWGVRFDSQNESGVSSTGVFKDVVAKSVAHLNNNGFGSLGRHNQVVQNYGGTPTIGDLSAFDTYFDQSKQVENVIAYGTKVGDINLLSLTELSNLGLDFAHFGLPGSQTIGLSFDRSLFPDEGSFLYHLAVECDNDIIAQGGNLETVPEPSAILGLTLVGLIGGSRLRKRPHVNQ